MIRSSVVGMGRLRQAMDRGHPLVGIKPSRHLAPPPARNAGTPDGLVVATSGVSDGARDARPRPRRHGGGRGLGGGLSRPRRGAGLLHPAPEAGREARAQGSPNCSTWAANRARPMDGAGGRRAGRSPRRRPVRGAVTSISRSNRDRPGRGWARGARRARRGAAGAPGRRGGARWPLRWVPAAWRSRRCPGGCAGSRPRPTGTVGVLATCREAPSVLSPRRRPGTIRGHGRSPPSRRPGGRSGQMRSRRMGSSGSRSGETGTPVCAVRTAGR